MDTISNIEKMYEDLKKLAGQTGEGSEKLFFDKLKQIKDAYGDCTDALGKIIKVDKVAVFVTAGKYKSLFDENDLQVISNVTDKVTSVEKCINTSADIFNLISDNNLEYDLNDPDKRKAYVDDMISKTGSFFSLAESAIGYFAGPFRDIITYPLQIGQDMLDILSNINTAVCERNKQLNELMDTLDSILSGVNSELSKFDNNKFNEMINFYKELEKAGVMDASKFIDQLNSMKNELQDTAKEFASNYEKIYNEKNKDNGTSVDANYSLNTNQIIQNIQQEEKKKVDPLSLDMNGDGFKVTSIEDGVYFDLDNNGLAEKINWISGGDAFLALDKDKDGIIENGNELFSEHTILKNGKSAKNGFEALAEYDDNKDGKINQQDAIYKELLIWIDKNQDGFSDVDELVNIESAGVSEIILNYKYTNQQLTDGVVLGNTAEFIFSNGQKGQTGELWVDARLHDTSDKNVQIEISDYIKSLPDVRSIGNVYSLHKSMALDTTGRLAALMENFLQSGSEKARMDSLEKMLEIMCVAEDIVDDSRGQFFNGKKLAIIECLMGRKYQGANGSDPNSLAAPGLMKSYKDYLELYYCEILGQTTLKKYKNVIKIKVGEDGIRRIDVEGFLNYIKVSLFGESNPKLIIEDIARYVKYLEKMGIAGFDDLASAFGDLEWLDNMIISRLSDNYIGGTENDDIIQGTTKDDILEGGLGNDTLYGGAGDDVYLFERGFGKDIINDDSGNDTIKFGEGIALEDIRIEKRGNGIALIVGSDEILIQNYMYGSTYQIENVELTDGSRYSLNEMAKNLKGTAGNDVMEAIHIESYMYGGAGDDRIMGSQGSDVLEGGEGNDTLYGGSGDDVYVFEKGFGRDIIGEDGGNDTIKFGEDIALEDIRIEKRGNGIALIVGSDEILIQNYMYGSTYQIENVELSDGSRYSLKEMARNLKGTAGNDVMEAIHIESYMNGGAGDDRITGSQGSDVLEGGEGNDILSGGAGDDELNGGRGNDTLYGGAGDDVYVFEKGFGRDIIGEDEGNDTIKFGEDIATEDIRIEKRGNGIALIVGTDEILIQNYMYGSTYQIENVELSDGSPYSLKEMARNLKGTAGNDVMEAIHIESYMNGGAGDDRITGSQGSDVLIGGEGNDILSGGAGDDELNGGRGNDTLYGGAGDDVYVFEKGFGRDIIGEDGGNDTIKFGEDIAIEDVRIEKRGNGIALIVGADEILIQNYMYGSTYQIENVELSDGSRYSLKEMAKNLIGTAGNDVMEAIHIESYMNGGAGDDRITGSQGSDVLEGGEGNDILSGGAGDDELNGGRGNDTLYGGAGDDVYEFEKGFGKDIINDDSGNDTIKFGEGISIEDIRIEKRGNGIALIVGSDEILIQNYMYGSTYQIENIEFSYGTVTNIDTLFNTLTSLNSTSTYSDTATDTSKLVSLMIQTYNSSSQDQALYTTYNTKKEETQYIDIFKSAAV